MTANPPCQTHQKALAITGASIDDALMSALAFIALATFCSVWLVAQRQKHPWLIVVNRTAANAGKKNNDWGEKSVGAKGWAYQEAGVL
jgi:hypothetical protein